MDEVKREMGLTPPEEHPAMSITFMALYLCNLSLAYKLTKKREYLESCCAWMDALSSYPGWGSDPKNVDIDLSASWVLWGMSLCCDWMFEDLHKEKRDTYVRTIAHHLSLFLSYVASHQGLFWPTEYWQNHNWINMTGIAAAGYFLQRHGFDDQGAIALTRDNFKEVFSRLAKDGSNYEGCCYWRYGGMWLFVYAWMERGEGGEDYFLHSDYLQNTFWYRLYQSSPDLSRNLNFGDTHDLYSSHPACVYYLVGRMYRNGYAQALGHLATGAFLEDEIERSKVHPGIRPEAGLELLWYDGSVFEADFHDLPLAREFPDLGLVSIRSSWEKDAMVFSAKCGCPGGETQWKEGWRMYRERGWRCMSLGHQHPDNLSYQLVLGDTYLIADDGYDRAIEAPYHSVPLVDGRYADVMGVSDVWRCSAEARIHEDSSCRPDESMCATMSRLESMDGVYGCEGRTEETYPLALKMKRASRAFLVSPGKWVCLVTSLSSPLAHTYTLVTNTFEDPVPVAEGEWKYPTSGISYKVVSDQPFWSELAIQSISAIMTPQEPDKVTRTEEHSLRLSTEKQVSDVVFVELFTMPGFSVNASYSSGKLVVDGKRYAILPALKREVF